MKIKNRLLIILVSFTLLNLGCDAAYSVTATRIKEVLDHPRDYEGKELTVYGTVTNSVSLLVVKYFEIQDDTGTIKIITDKVLPTRGEKLRVTGRMGVIEVGTDHWVVLRENSDSHGQDGKSPGSGAATIPRDY